MSYSFRIRFKLPNRLRIGIDADRWVLTTAGTRPEILLRSNNQRTAISASTDLVFCGDGYQTEDRAYAAAEELRDAISMAFARLRIGADFGGKVPQGIYTTTGLQEQQNSFHQRVLNDVYGTKIFLTEPIPRFVSFQTDCVHTKGQNKFIEALKIAYEMKEQVAPEYRLAFDLFNASFFEPSADARLLMLMMGVETLLKPDLRSISAQRHIRKLICRTKFALNLPRQERDSIVGSLNWVLRESRSQAGRKLATHLGAQKYLDMSAVKFFTYCYTLRSRLVHGYLPRPRHEDVDTVAANLEEFLGDLLSGPLFHKVSL